VKITLWWTPPESWPVDCWGLAYWTRYFKSDGKDIKSIIPFPLEAPPGNSRNCGTVTAGYTEKVKS